VENVALNENLELTEATTELALISVGNVAKAAVDDENQSAENNELNRVQEIAEGMAEKHASQQSCGDPSVIVETESISIASSKKKTNDINQEDTSIDVGTSTVTVSESAAQFEECLSFQVVTYEENIYGDDEEIIAGVTTVNLEGEDSPKGKNAFSICLAHETTEFPKGSCDPCVFYDEATGGWSGKGCTMNRETSTPEKTCCDCNHLTDFSILLQGSGQCNESKRAETLQWTMVGLLGAAVLAVAVFMVIYDQKKRRAAAKLEKKLSSRPSNSTR